MGQCVTGEFFNRGNPTPDFRMGPSISIAPEPKTHGDPLAWSTSQASAWQSCVPLPFATNVKK